MGITRDSTLNDKLNETSRLLHAASDPIRLRILQIVDVPCAVRELCAELEMSQPRISHHLAILLAAGLLRRERHGRENHYARADHELGDSEDEFRQLLWRWIDGGSTAARPQFVPAPELDDFLL